MKILYAVQATGNGHISRAMELLPVFRKYGKVDVFLSGANSSLDFDVPVAYRSKGLSLFYTCNGNLDIIKTILSVSPLRIRREIKDLPIEKYDVILNDFDCITALACAVKKIPSINFGHQASFQSAKTPRPTEKSNVGEWILKNFARASSYIGLHFKQYDDFILPPVINKEICNGDPIDKKFIAVYLPSYCEKTLAKYFHPLPGRFQVFSRETDQIKQSRNITFMPVNKKLFNEALITCSGIITGAGFETPSEALKLGKKLMVMPIRGQYEQECNGAALAAMGVKKIDRLDKDFTDHFSGWTATQPIKVNYDHSTEDIVARVMELAITQLNGNRNDPDTAELRLLQLG